MDEIKRLYAGTVNNTEIELINLTNGAVLKTILIGNNTETKQTVTFNIDGTVFLFDVEAKSTLILDKAIVCNILKATATESLKVHISGIQLGGA
ncbi:MAG: hypothetical protein GX275_06060 [Clostridiales bacterium]|nr:hypothetical protein [Clostridiales bacterium]